MLVPRTRIIVSLICLGLIGISVYYGRYMAAVVALVVIFFTIYGYVRQGTVYLAFRSLKSGDVIKAKEYLAMTKKVNWLSDLQKSHYYFVQGYIDMAQGTVPAAIEGFEKALALGLKLKSDTAMAYANLANLYHRKKDKTKAREYILKAKEIKVKKHVAQEIERLEAAIF